MSSFEHSFELITIFVMQVDLVAKLSDLKRSATDKERRTKDLARRVKELSTQLQKHVEQCVIRISQCLYSKLKEKQLWRCWAIFELFCNYASNTSHTGNRY